MEEILNGVYQENNKIYTKNLTPGKRVYGENLVNEKGTEYRGWDPNRSKLGAAIKNGLKNFPLNKNSLVLYLGIATGTTASHVSDISDTVFGIDISSRVLRELISVSEDRGNIVPMLQDASNPVEYADLVPEVDILYQDVSHRKQGEIFVKNSEFLKDDGYGYLAVKARSVDVTEDPEKIYKEIKDYIKSEINVEFLEEIDLSPFEKDHRMMVMKVNK